MVDLRVTCLDGKYHPVDSSEMSFKMAARLALREALAHAGPVVLEPVDALEVTVPTELQGDVMGDLHTRRARVLGTELGGEGEQVVLAHVPASELRRYAVDLRSRTSGTRQLPPTPRPLRPAARAPPGRGRGPLGTRRQVGDGSRVGSVTT